MPLGYSGGNVRSLWYLMYSQKDNKLEIAHGVATAFVSSLLYVGSITSSCWESDTLIEFMSKVAWPRFSIIG